MATLNEVIIRRTRAGEIETNLPRQIVHHSPTGYEIGYSGCGSTELALNILAHFLPAPQKPELPSHDAREWSQDEYEKDAAYRDGVVVCTNGVCSRHAYDLRCRFRNDFLVGLRLSNGQSVTFTAAEISAWIDGQGETGEGDYV